MVELGQVAGAILRSIAQSRVLSDKFTKDASLEYEKDTVMRAFPIPRLEIKEATVNIPFALKAVKAATSGSIIADIAVTTDELANLPETSISRVTLVLNVKNYTWTQVEETPGKPAKKLVPE